MVKAEARKGKYFPVIRDCGDVDIILFPRCKTLSEVECDRIRKRTCSFSSSSSSVAPLCLRPKDETMSALIGTLGTLGT